MSIKHIITNKKINTIIKYSSIKYIALIIGFLKGIINARALGPELFGILGNLLLVLSYLSYSNLGILYSMNREYVVYEGSEDKGNADKVINTAFTSLGILSIILLIIALVTKKIYKGYLGNYVFLVFIIAILDQYKNFYMNYFRLKNDFRKMNYIELINNILSFIIIIMLINNFKIYGILASMIISGSMIFIYSYIHSTNIILSIDKNILKSLITMGVPLLIYNLGFYILTTVDRMMIIKFLGYEDLGYYTFANQIVSGTLVFITSVLFLYYPKAIKNLNVDKNKELTEVLLKTEKYTKYVEVFGVILCLIGCIVINPFVYIAAPQYEVSINIYRILLFGTIANQLTYFCNVFIVSNKKQKYLIYLQIITIIIAIILNFISIQLNMGIVGVSIATLITNFIYSIIQHYIYLKILNINICYAKNILKVYYKFSIYVFINLIISINNINILMYSIILCMTTILLYYRDIKLTILEIKNI